MFVKCRYIFLIALLGFFPTACATQSETALRPQTTRAASAYHSGPKIKVSVGEFDNRTNFMRGVFANGKDVLGNQARTILKTHLQETRRFNVLDRRNLERLSAEAGFSNEKQNIIGAEFIITGDVVEYGRKNVGDEQFFGILGKGKSQIAYAKVNLQLVNIKTSEVVFTAQGAGEVSLSNREIIGFGGTAGYDSTLHGKVLNLAIREAVDSLVVNINVS